MQAGIHGAQHRTFGSAGPRDAIGNRADPAQIGICGAGLLMHYLGNEHCRVKQTCDKKGSYSTHSIRLPKIARIAKSAKIERAVSDGILQRSKYNSAAF